MRKITAEKVPGGFSGRSDAPDPKSRTAGAWKIGRDLV